MINELDEDELRACLVALCWVFTDIEDKHGPLGATVSSAMRKIGMEIGLKKGYVEAQSVKLAIRRGRIKKNGHKKS